MAKITLSDLNTAKDVVKDLNPKEAKLILGGQKAGAGTSNDDLPEGTVRYNGFICEYYPEGYLNPKMRSFS